jgi:hypothetical protein
MKYVFIALGLYILYQFLFKLVIPVFIATRKIKKGFREMQSRMQEQMQQQQQEQAGFNTNAGAAEPDSKYKAGDYIEFEEVK